MMKAPRRVAFIGEAMMEIAPRPAAPGTAGIGPAGDVLNTAVYFRRARRNPVAARLVTVLGHDPFSDRIGDFASEEGLELGGIRRHPTAACGLYAVATAATGERSFSYWRSASAARTLFSEDEDFANLADCDVLFLTGITLAIITEGARARLRDWIGAARRGGVAVAFDSNYRPALWEDPAAAAHWIDAFWRSCDIAFPSIDDETALFGEARLEAVLERFKGYGIAHGALKAGDAGSYILGGRDLRIAATPVAEVVDTTAAGDSFNAGFLAALLSGAGAVAATEAGHALASEVIKHPGAIIPRDRV